MIIKLLFASESFVFFSNIRLLCDTCALLSLLRTEMENGAVLLLCPELSDFWKRNAFLKVPKLCPLVLLITALYRRR